MAEMAGVAQGRRAAGGKSPRKPALRLAPYPKFELCDGPLKYFLFLRCIGGGGGRGSGTMMGGGEVTGRGAGSRTMTGAGGGG